MSSAVITISGFVGTDAVTKTVGQNDVTEFTVAVSPDPKNKDKTDWYRCSIWGERGKKVAQYIKKSTYMVVSGRFTANTYTSKDGEIMIGFNIGVDNFDLGPSSTPKTNTTGISTFSDGLPL